MTELIDNDPPIICEECGNDGPHLRIGSTLYCNDCNEPVEEGW